MKCLKANAEDAGILQGTSLATIRGDLIAMIEQKPTTAKEPIAEQGTLFDRAVLEQLTVKEAQWEETMVKKSLERMPERDALITTSGVPINRLYTPVDNASLD